VGDHWYRARQADNRTFLTHLDSDFWINWEQDRWLADPRMPGALTLFGPKQGEDPYGAGSRQHASYAHHIVSKKEVEGLKQGVLKRYWRIDSHNDHYLDASKMADVAASMKGMRVSKEAANGMTVNEWCKARGWGGR
jgi:hypothetical protein